VFIYGCIRLYCWEVVVGEDDKAGVLLAEI